MKNSSKIYLANIKTDSFTLFPEIWNFFSEFKEIYFDEKAPPGILWVSENSKWKRFKREKIKIKNKTLFLLGDKSNRDYISGLFKNKLVEIRIKYLLPEGKLKDNFFCVVRPLPDALYFSNKLEKLGAKAIPFPVLKFEIERLKNFERVLNQKWDYVIFTSKRGVIAFKSILNNPKKIYDFLRDKKILCIGSETEKKISELGFESIVPKEFSQEGIVDYFLKNVKNKKRVLILRTQGREYVIEKLREMRHKVEEIKIYRMVFEDKNKLKIFFPFIFKARDFIFTSPKLFDAFLEITGKKGEILLNKSRIISIGRITEKHIIKKGFKVHLVPEKFTGDGIIKELLKRKWSC